MLFVLPSPHFVAPCTVPPRAAAPLALPPTRYAAADMYTKSYTKFWIFDHLQSYTVWSQNQILNFIQK